MIVERQNVVFDMPEYLRHIGKALVLYGMGRGGVRAYHKMKSLGIKIDAVVDGDVSKQHTFMDELEILSPKDAMQKYTDAVFVITVLQPGLAAEIEKTLNKDGNSREIIIYNAALFNDINRPFAIYGKNRLARAVRRQLTIENLDFRGYLILKTEDAIDFAGEKTVSLHELAQTKENINIILCEKKEEEKIAWYLKKNNLIENCFHGYDASFGFFEGEKYKPAKAMVRDLLYPHLCALNKIYFGLAGATSRRLFTSVCRDFFNGGKSLSMTEYRNIVKERHRWLCDFLPAGAAKFELPCQNIKEFLRFIIMLDKLTANRSIGNINLRETDGVIIVTYSKEGNAK